MVSCHDHVGFRIGFIRGAKFPQTKKEDDHFPSLTVFGLHLIELRNMCAIKSQLSLKRLSELAANSVDGCLRNLKAGKPGVH